MLSEKNSLCFFFWSQLSAESLAFLFLPHLAITWQSSKWSFDIECVGVEITFGLLAVKDIADSDMFVVLC